MKKLFVLAILLLGPAMTQQAAACDMAAIETCSWPRQAWHFAIPTYRHVAIIFEQGHGRKAQSIVGLTCNHHVAIEPSSFVTASRTPRAGRDESAQRLRLWRSGVPR